MAADQETFHQVLISILSVDNATRLQAEEAYNLLPLPTRVTYLLGSIHNATLGEEVRQMAAVLLRRLFAAEFNDFYPQLPPESQAALKTEILRAVQSEQSDGMRRKICDAAAEVARNLIDDDGNNTWPEFLTFLFQCVNSSTPVLKEAALRMFTSVPGVFGNQQAHYLDVIKQMIQLSMTEDSGYPVQFQAVRAVCSFIMAHEKETSIQKHFADVLPSLVQITATSVAMQEDDALVKCIIDLAEAAPRFLRPQLDSLFELCIKVLSNEEFYESWRHLCLEVMVTLAETAPPMVRKVGAKYLPLLVPQVLKMMTDVDDDDDWSFSDEIVDEDNDSNTVVAESALDRLSCGLGGKTMMPHIELNIPAMLANPDWKYRHAALMALSAVGEGCHKQMEALLPQIMDPVLQFLSDPHPRVRYAACNALGQMSTDFAPHFEKKFHEKVVPGLLMVLDDNANPRVQAHAGAALVNFSEDCPKQILTLYLDAIMGKLEAILSAKFTELVEKGTKLVLEQVVTTIASVADTSEEQFVAYYDRLMPCLKYIIQNANTEELKLLRGKAIECVSLVGLAVGPDKFIADASEVMDMLLKTQTDGDLPDDDVQTSYLISAWARICKILGKRFEQYLPLVMGPVMKAASMKPEVALVDNEDMDNVDDDQDWQFVNLGEQQNFGIKTAGDMEVEVMKPKQTFSSRTELRPSEAQRQGEWAILTGHPFSSLEDKASACEMLVCYARELKEGFADYTEDVVKLMVPMLKFYFHDGVRTAAAESLPYLLDCGKIKGPAFLQGMWSFICPELLKAMDTEPENDVLIEHMYAMAKCIETLGNGCLSEESMTELIRILDKIMTEHFEHAAGRQEKRRDEDYDEIVEEQLVDEDNEDVFLLSKVADVVHALFLSYKEAFFPYFDRLCGHFVKCLAPDMPWTDHQWALCVFDDCIEFGGPACAAYQSLFLGPLLRHVADPAAEVRQAAAYGWGVLGQFGGDAFAAACADAIPELVKVITAPESRAVENINPTENAISAVTKILKHNGSRINLTEMLPHWLSWLPVWEDDDEAPHVYGYLCDLLEANHAAVLGPNHANLPRLIAIVAEAFRREAVPREHAVYDRMANIVRTIQGNAEMFQACIAQLTAEQQQALHAALTAPAPAPAQ